MTRMPKQLIVLGLLLLVYFLPLDFISYFEPRWWLASVISIQLLLVFLCNKIVSESWICPILFIESGCMIFNATLFILPHAVIDFHADFMKMAFIIELLTITISLWGNPVERFNQHRLRLACPGLCGSRGSLFFNFRS